jgi:CheY-like chemotaxis protein
MGEDSVQPGIDVLVIDDEEIIRNLFSDILQEIGCRVSVAASGLEALEKAREICFRIAFIDVHMPEMNGVETLRALKKISPKTTIVMTDSFPDFLLEQAESEGAVTCINKPFDIREVKGMIQALINKDGSV